MTSADLLMRDLIAISVRLQECEYIAKRAGRPDLATEFHDASERLAADIRRLMIPGVEVSK